MAAKKDTIPQYDYNVYKLADGVVEEFIDFILKRRFEEIEIRPSVIPDLEGLPCRLFFCDKEKAQGSPWINLLNECTDYDLGNSIRVYGAVLLYYVDDDVFAISYGNAHFYISGFCNHTFGIDVAERLLDWDKVKAQQNLVHGGKTSKTHVDYSVNAALSYGSGEIPNFIRGCSINVDMWGAMINCATAAQFKWPEKPMRIGRRLRQLSSALKEEAIHDLPKLMRLDKEIDFIKIQRLDAVLANAIANYDGTSASSAMNIPSFFLVGTKLFQNDAIGFTLYGVRRSKEYIGELTIERLLEFVREFNIDLGQDIRKIKVRFVNANDQYTPKKDIIEYLEFITDDSGEHYCLRDGHWCVFNRAYLQEIWNGLANLHFENHIEDEIAYSKERLRMFIQENGMPAVTKCDETLYNQYLASKMQGICVHPNLKSVDPNENGNYSFEPADIYVGDKLFYVKIGDSSDFAYAIDQVELVLDVLRRDMNTITMVDGTVIQPTALSLILVFKDRKTLVNEWKDIKSINFLLHLARLKRKISDSFVSLEVHFMYGALTT